MTTIILWASFVRRARHGGSILYAFPGGTREWVPRAQHTRATVGPGQSPESGFPERLLVSRTWAEQHLAAEVARVEAGPAIRQLERPPELVKSESSTVPLVLDFAEALRESGLGLGEAAVVLGLTPKQVRLLWEGWLRFSTQEDLNRAAQALQAEKERRTPRGANGERR